MSGVIGTFRIGEDITIALDVVSGSTEDVLSVSASITRARPNIPSFQVDASFTPIALTVAPRAATETIPSGWNITMPAASTANLSPGTYGIDAKIVFTSGAVQITSTTALISVTKGALS